MNNDVKYSCTVTPKIITANDDDDFLERFAFEIPKCANVPVPCINHIDTYAYENINPYNDYVNFMCYFNGFLT